MVKNPPANVDVSSIPGSGIYPGEEKDNPLQYSCLRNLCLATVHWVAKELDMTYQLNDNNKVLIYLKNVILLILLFFFKPAIFIPRSGFILRDDHVKLCSLQRTHSIPNFFTCSVDCDTAAMEP